MATREYKVSYWHEAGRETDYFTPLTISQLLDVAVERWPDVEAVVSLFQNERLTFTQVREQADRLAAGMLQLGLNPGDHIAIWSPNCSEWIITRIAAARCGLVIAQLDPTYQPPQLLQILNKVEIKALVCGEELFGSSYYEKLLQVIPELESGLEFHSAQAPSLKFLCIISEKPYKGAHRYCDIVASANAETLERLSEVQQLVQPDDDCAIYLTSGTTGYPKAVIMSHHNLINNSKMCGTTMGYKVGSKLVVPVPLSHISGSLGGIISALCYGVTCVLPSPFFDAKKTVEAIQQENCYSVIGTPPLYVRMLDVAAKENITIPKGMIAVVGGAPCSTQLAQSMIETFGFQRICPVFGMTELAVAFAGLPGDTLDQMTSTVGHVTVNTEVKVVDDKGRMVPMGTAGELWIRAYSVTRGYWADEQKTKEFIRPDGWARTGDLFVLQENGYGKVVGRIKDIIIKEAINIIPAELEEFFEKHPDIVEAQVFGIPDPKVGEELCVYLRLRKEVSLSEEDIKDYCKDKISNVMIPRYIRFVEEFPKTTSGKVSKVKLLEDLQKELSSK